MNLDSHREQTSEVLRNFRNLQSQTKLWAIQTRHKAQTEVQILLTKANSYLQHFQQTEDSISKHANELWHLKAENKLLQSESLSAKSEFKLNKDDAEAKAIQIAWLEDQLSKAQEQVASARKKAAQLRVDHGGMVQRSDLEALQTQLNELDRTYQLENKRLRDALQALNQNFSAVDSERAAHVIKMQVCIF